MKLTSVANGAPCWFEFSSVDAARSLVYFQALFGWQAEHQDMGDMGVYTFLRHVSGGMVGAHWQMPEAQKAMNIPSNWGVYFKVEDVAISHALALKMGAQELVAPMAVSDYGRMSVLSDPAGAVLSLWQEVQVNSEPLVMFEAQSIGWVELASRNSPVVEAFYQQLLGWEYKKSELNPGQFEYTHYKAAGTDYGGIMPMGPEWGDMPSHWSIYIVVDNVEATIERSSSLGGGVCVQPFDVADVGRLAVINDPTGGNFYIIALAK